MPAAGELDTDGPRHSPTETLRELLTVDADAVRAELPQVEEHLAKFGDALPARDHARSSSDLKTRLG